ncbi:hypothetical protein B0A49_07104 [Cryomyces minteri]|uniref:Uncharacterized protein n=1 Tax=Cryomyces minteri TaxID=331657 RepID=A0A4U0WYI5_9PEZI|nr:hypothetical protein B0A49_07104 [Cryomyces minteri]
MAVLAPEDIPSVQTATAKLQELLDEARKIKTVNTVEPPLSISALTNGIDQFNEATSALQVSQGVIEKAARNISYELLASTDIDDPSFVHVWDLLDILQVLGDRGKHFSGIKVFDYMESRRERLIAKEFHKKFMVILRSCNELLRRLSRAEDAVFCGRVFFYLFQTFPLGDKSSVNLRGEFHVENTTVFDDVSREDEQILDNMVVDTESIANTINTNSDTNPSVEAGAAKPAEQHATTPSKEKRAIGEEDVLETNALYPIFWRLQQDFSNPTRLFSGEHFKVFKKGLQLTTVKFKTVPTVLQTRGPGDLKRGVKRKRDGGAVADSATVYNPKYLTSRDLFELELSDLAFQQHILVQALILIDFLLSLTQKSKQKMVELNAQKALLYDYTLSDENTDWALSTRSTIADYLRQGPEGKFYYRMVDTVLTRDKNWYLKAKLGAQKATANKRLRASPMGSLDLTFLSDAEIANGLKMLKDPNRYCMPSAESFVASIANDELDMEMAMTDEDKQTLQDAKASKIWRALRIAAKSKLSRFDQVDDGNNLQRLFEPDSVGEPVIDHDAVDVTGSKGAEHSHLHAEEGGTA